MRTTVLVSILMICIGAAMFLRYRPRWTRFAASGPDDLGGAPAPTVAPAPGPPPAPPAARAEPMHAPAARTAEIIETPAERPAPPALRRARGNDGFGRFASPADRTRAGRL
ncbi:hypothetical protein ACIBSW_13510 [Actinoplanes sp. NPDC049668]|uniref:hypothetical protein n=1 Tax=unclassified Actinoplanes TaxID=2626549 RepID=UPI0033ADF89E